MVMIAHVAWLTVSHGGEAWAWKGAQVGPTARSRCGDSSFYSESMWELHMLLKAGGGICPGENPMHQPSCCDESQVSSTEHRIPGRGYPLMPQRGRKHPPCLNPGQGIDGRRGGCERQ